MRSARAALLALALLFGEDLPAPWVVAAAAAGALALLGAGALVGRRVRKPPRRKPPRGSFEAGRQAGLRSGLLGEADVPRWLGRAAEGRVLDVRPDGQGGLVVRIQRRRGSPCERVAGLVVGALECAWACEVEWAHPECGASPCVYRVRRRGGGFSGSGVRREAGGTRGW